MKFLTSYHTDIGIRKATNQDALLLKVGSNKFGKKAIFAICDGMGGLSSGEIASSTVIKHLSDWFENEIPILEQRPNKYDEIIRSLKHRVRMLNDKIYKYGEAKEIKLGTTLTAILFIDNKYIIVHVGDSRAYSINKNLTRITKDQSFVQREIDRGNITEEEARTHKKKNLLLQCIGVTPTVEILTYTGNIDKKTTYIICSDGFYNKISDEELIKNLKYSKLKKEKKIKNVLIKLVDTVKSRNETDNISVLAIKIK